MLNFLRRLPLISASNYLLVHQKLVPQVPQTIASDTLVLDVVPQGPQTSASSAPDECPKFPKRVPQVPQTSAPSSPNECPKCPKRVPQVPQCPKCVIRWSRFLRLPFPGLLHSRGRQRISILSSSGLSYSWPLFSKKWFNSWLFQAPILGCF